jgi:hypothetical protein
MSMVALQQAARTNSREAYKMYTEVRREGWREGGREGGREAERLLHSRMPEPFS